MATATEVLADVRRLYATGTATNPKLRAIRKKLVAGTATHKDLYEYAKSSGSVLSDALKANLTDDLIVNGAIPPDIVATVLAESFDDAWADVTAFGETLQTSLNNGYGIGIKGVKPIKNNRADGIVKRIVTAQQYADIKWILDAPIETMVTKIADDVIYANADCMARAGIPTVISRVTNGGCCEWCEKLAGAFRYGDHPDDIFRRHQRCTCTVEFQANGKLQDAWTKRKYSRDQRDANREFTNKYMSEVDKANAEWKQYTNNRQKAIKKYMAEGLTGDELKKAVNREVGYTTKKAIRRRHNLAEWKDHRTTYKRRYKSWK